MLSCEPTDFKTWAENVCVSVTGVLVLRGLVKCDGFLLPPRSGLVEKTTFRDTERQIITKQHGVTLRRLLTSSAALCGPHKAEPRYVLRLVSSFSKTLRSEERHDTDEAAPVYSSLRLAAVPNLLRPCTSIHTKTVRARAHTHTHACVRLRARCPVLSDCIQNWNISTTFRNTLKY